MKYKYNQEYKKELKETLDQLRAILRETKPALGSNENLSDIWAKTESGKKSLKELIEHYKDLSDIINFFNELCSPCLCDTALISSLKKEAESIKKEIGLFIKLYDIFRKEDRDLVELINQAGQKSFIAQQMSVLSLFASATVIILTLLLI